MPLTSDRRQTGDAPTELGLGNLETPWRSSWILRILEMVRRGVSGREVAVEGRAAPGALPRFQELATSVESNGSWAATWKRLTPNCNGTGGPVGIVGRSPHARLEARGLPFQGRRV